MYKDYIYKIAASKDVEDKPKMQNDSWIIRHGRWYSSDKRYMIEDIY